MSDQNTKKYFLPALYLKFFGAIMLGVIYQFYYRGGDTFGYFIHGSKWIYEAFWEDPVLGLKLLWTEGGERFPETFSYSSRIWYYRDPHSYFIVRITAFFDLFTFHTYSATALFFAFFSFTGLWKLYETFYKLYPEFSKEIAIAILFVPSVFFWGSGILKDTVTLGALGWSVYCFFEIFENRRRIVTNVIAFLFFSFIIFEIKKYILLCLLASLSVWLYSKYIGQFRNKLVKTFVAPLLFFFFLGGGFLLISKVSEDDSRYAVTNIATTAAITANDIRYGWGARHGENSGYTLGQLDGTWSSILSLMPSAINVSLFRPYLWEVRNPLMFISALESLFVLILSIRMVMKPRSLLAAMRNPHLRFCFVFSLLFAFAVGVSTFNFGTLSRYKIPLIPFFYSFIFVARRRSTAR